MLVVTNFLDDSVLAPCVLAFAGTATAGLTAAAGLATATFRAGAGAAGFTAFRTVLPASFFAAGLAGAAALRAGAFAAPRVLRRAGTAGFSGFFDAEAGRAAAFATALAAGRAAVFARTGALAGFACLTVFGLLFAIPRPILVTRRSRVIA